MTDSLLCAAVNEIEDGLVDANLGGGVYKKRIALPGRGKRGSVRSILAYNRDDKVFFIYGYAKKEKENLAPDEEQALKQLGKNLIALNQRELHAMIINGKLKEVNYVR